MKLTVEIMGGDVYRNGNLIDTILFSVRKSVLVLCFPSTNTTAVGYE